jgi:GntR family transcriptional regulator, transcriptional repressor for pyruvate dehydrogenase complex
VTSAPVSDRVFRLLLDELADGRYAPGDKLPTQRALAARLGVNMSGIREAVKRLEQLGLVDVRQGDAMRARDWRDGAGLDVVAPFLFSGERPAVVDLMEARRLMLAQVARLAAARRHDRSAERLGELADALASAESTDAAQALDFAFFDELVRASGNVIFRLVMNSIRNVYFEHAELFSAVADVRLSPHYRRAAEAVAERDADAAERAVRDLAAAQEGRLTGTLE